MIPVNRPLIEESEILAVVKTMESGSLSGDTQTVRAAEQALTSYLSVKHTVLVNSGTSAIDLLVESLDIQEGDECILPSLTIISTATALLRKRAKIKLIDVDEDYWCMNASQASSEVTQKTKLLMPVHLYGMAVDVPTIRNAIKNTECLIIEDAAESLGQLVRGENCGSMGDAGILSFYANKVVTCGEGGAVATNSEQISERVRYFRNLCFNSRQRFVHEDLGWNMRISSLQAAMIPSQIERISSIVERKKNIAQDYINRLHGHPWISFQKSKTDWCENSYWVVGILLAEDCRFDAEALSKVLMTKGIETRRFFCPLHLQPIIRSLGLDFEGSFPVSEKLWSHGLYLPSGLGTTKDEIEIVCAELWNLTK